MCYAYPELCCPQAGCGWPNRAGSTNTPLTPVPNAQGQNVSLDAIEAVLNEIAAISPDNCMHLGGDEVDQTCWQNDPATQVRRRARGRASVSRLHIEHAPPRTLCRRGCWRTT